MFLFIFAVKKAPIVAPAIPKNISETESNVLAYSTPKVLSRYISKNSHPIVTKKTSSRILDIFISFSKIKAKL